MDVLIVEQNELLAGMIAAALAEDGLIAAVVADEQTALTIPMDDAPRVVITGMNRIDEDMKGLIAANTLRARWPAVGVLFMAALWPVRLRHNDLSNRDRFLSKPARLASITGTVRELLHADPWRYPPG